MGFFLIGAFINYEQRYKDGKPDGYNVLLAIGVDAHRVKVSDELFHVAGIDALSMGDKVSCKVHFNVFRDKVYFMADSVDLVVE